MTPFYGCSLPLGLLFLLFAPLALVAHAQTGVFVNEIHYDNESTDTGEAIEVAGPAGVDLAEWSLVLYNGSGGSVYDTQTLSGTIPDQCGGYGMVALTYPSNGIQNGPDGLALVDASGAVVQFLSYEGGLTATEGPAGGLTSQDIGVEETSSTPVGASLQLVGTGTAYGDFTWSAEPQNTFGDCNTGQIFGDGGPVGTDVVINEIDSDTPGSDDREFIELFDGGSGNTPLDGLVVVLYNGSSDEVYDAIDLSGFSTDTDGYFPPRQRRRDADARADLLERYAPERSGCRCALRGQRRCLPRRHTHYHRKPSRRRRLRHRRSGRPRVASTPEPRPTTGG